MPHPKFNTSPFETRLITQIARGAVAHAKESGIEYDTITAEMDITACHCNGCPLDLNRLLAAPDPDFGHDIFGIRRFLDRSTGKLTQLFDPRCSMPAAATKKEVMA